MSLSIVDRAVADKRKMNYRHSCCVSWHLSEFPLSVSTSLESRWLSSNFAGSNSFGSWMAPKSIDTFITKNVRNLRRYNRKEDE